MPRSIKLSWQAGADGSGRAGRWRKKYKGEVYYFPGGKGKSDREAYDAALAAWEKLKGKIDLTTPRKHQRDYEQCIGQWEQVLAFSNRYGDREHADQAVEKLTDLRRRFAASKLTPLKREDQFDANFDLPIDAEWVRELPKLVGLVPPDDSPLPPEPAIPARVAFALGLDPPYEPVVVTSTQEQIDRLDGSPLRIARELWRDRLAVMKQKAAPEDESLEFHVQKFLAQKQKQAKVGDISDGRFYALKLHLTDFQDWLGKDTSVKEIDGEVLVNYRMYLLEKTVSKSMGKTSANHYLTTLKSFVRWLWQSNTIAVLPRVLEDRSKPLKIHRSSPNIVVFDKDEITTLLTKASDRTKLYILLMLNCGMTQKDISDLLVSEVDWKEGRIIRKRSKTSEEENVPVVNYTLWPETFRLLKQERDAKSKERVLSNNNGSPIWSEELSEDGKYKKNDNVKSAFERLRKATKIEKPLKSLKKTSASLLRDNGEFASLDGLFLGHAPHKMSDKHYSKVPQNLFDQAVQWLGEQYGIV
jgi:integrase